MTRLISYRQQRTNALISLQSSAADLYRFDYMQEADFHNIEHVSYLRKKKILAMYLALDLPLTIHGKLCFPVNVMNIKFIRKRWMLI